MLGSVRYTSRSTISSRIAHQRQLHRSVQLMSRSFADQSLNHLYHAVQRLTPLSLADSSWDNTGVLIEVPKPRETPAGSPKTVLCCIDLTPQVLQEAIASPSTFLILTYHPPIFSGLKSLTLSSPLQSSLLTCIQEGISLLTIHTSADNALNGVNDHLASIIFFDEKLSLGGWNDQVQAIKPFADPPRGQEGAGTGRLVTFKSSPERTKMHIVMALKKGLKLQYLQAAWAPTGKDLIKTVAICAGSGSSVLKGVKADLYLTGELGHHEILAANAQGIHVILTNHSASERPWLTQFAPRLLTAMTQIALEQGEVGNYEVVVSKSDREPLQVV